MQFKLQDFTIDEGLPMSHAFEDAKGVYSIEEYCDKVVMRMGEDARDFVINITPLVMWVSLEVAVYVDEPKRAEIEMENQLY